MLSKVSSSSVSYSVQENMLKLMSVIHTLQMVQRYLVEKHWSIQDQGPYAARKWKYLQQVEQVLISLQLLPFVFAQRFETFVFVQGHHVRQLLFVLLGEFLVV